MTTATRDIRRTPTRDIPAAIKAMDYRRCPVCGADGMERLAKRIADMHLCRVCRNVNMGAACPNDEQLAAAKLVLCPWLAEVNDDD